mgnify:CR=1 FL=1
MIRPPSLRTQSYISQRWPGLHWNIIKRRQLPIAVNYEPGNVTLLSDCQQNDMRLMMR